MDEETLDPYPLRQAVRDALKAIRANVLTYGAVVVISYLMSALALIVALLVLEAIFVAIVQHATAFTETVVVSGVVLVGIGVAWYVAVYAFVLGCTALAVQDGATGHRGAIGATLRQSWRLLGRMAGANLMVAGVALWPLAAAVAAGFGLTVVANDAGWTLAVGTLLIVAAAIWGAARLIRYALAPYVSLFEPAVPLRQVLGRSRDLMVQGGQWFAVKGGLVLVGLFLLLSAIMHTSTQDVTNGANPVLNVILTVLSILTNAVLVMLYRNRKLVKA